MQEGTWWTSHVQEASAVSTTSMNTKAVVWFSGVRQAPAETCGSLLVLAKLCIYMPEERLLCDEHRKCRIAMVWPASLLPLM